MVNLSQQKRLAASVTGVGQRKSKSIFTAAAAGARTSGIACGNVEKLPAGHDDGSDGEMSWEGVMSCKRRRRTGTLQHAKKIKACRD